MRTGAKIFLGLLGGIATGLAVRQIVKAGEEGAFLPMEVVDLDSNNNGVVDRQDKRNFAAASGTSEGDPDYERRFDANFDGVIDGEDRAILDKTMGKRLGDIRASIKKGLSERLVWPDGWEAYLCAVDPDAVQQFTGHPSKEGWISVRYHPYIGPGEYVCLHYAVDTMVAAYKCLGYGCLMEAGGYGHAYILCWLGGNWRDLGNWMLVESETGDMFSAAKEELPSVYQTTSIFFPDWFEPKENLADVLHGHTLKVDYDAKTVDFGGTDQAIGVTGLEEPVPDTFDRTLGVAWR